MVQLVSYMMRIEELRRKLAELKQKQPSASIAAKPRSQMHSVVLIEVFAGIMVGSFLGYGIDQYFDTLPLFLFVFSIFGVVAGIYNVYKELVKIDKSRS